MKTRLFVTASFMAALCCITTFAVRIPAPVQGYIHPGDGMVLLCSLLLPPLWGAAAAGLGSALADLLAGYAHYAAVTFIIKALMPLICGFLFRYALRFTAKRVLPFVLGAMAAECWMLAGYFIFAVCLTGKTPALAALPLNAAQGVFGCAMGAALFSVIRRNPVMRLYLYHWKGDLFYD
ncbi:MAG: ECF transporter S component [Clostridia bacterium]|nr:ECF transporter S component [Clostridia bacterium]